MIKLSIQDYQAISSVELTINGFTLVVGDSNRGKSSIQRAINGCLHNEAGDHFVRLNQPRTKVILNDGSNEIIWIKGKHDNTFEVNGEVFDKMGTDAPPVLKELGYTDLDVDGETYNVQIADQFDPPFAVTKSSGKLGALYASITKTDIISKAATNCSDDLKDLKKALNVEIKERDTLSSKIKKIPTVEEDLLRIKRLIDIFKQKQLKEALLVKLKKFKTDMDSLNNKLSILESISYVNLPNIAVFKQKIDLSIKLTKQHAQLNNHLEVVSSLIKVSSVVLPTENLNQIALHFNKKQKYLKYKSNLTSLVLKTTELKKIKKVKQLSTNSLGTQIQKIEFYKDRYNMFCRYSEAVGWADKVAKIDLKPRLTSINLIYSNLEQNKQKQSKLADYKKLESSNKDAILLVESLNSQIAETLHDLSSWDVCPLCEQKLNKV